MKNGYKFEQNPGNTAICYYRYSSDAQRDCSIDQQRQAAHEYAAKKGLRIIREYEEHAISGTRDDRPQYNLMLYEIEKIRPAYLILWKTDRLSRDKYALVMAKKRLRECGVKLNYVAEAVPDDDEATQVLLESLYEGIAASFIVSHRKNVMRGLNYNAERAIYNGHILLGYKGEPDKQYVIDEANAEIVKKIFKDYVDGVPKKRICDELNAKGIKTSFGNKFTVNSLTHILKNDSYLGIYKYGDYRIEGGMPRIIDDALFEAAQRKMKANQRGGKHAILKINPNADIADFWLSGKLYCKECGCTVTGCSGTSKSGDLFYYYACSGHRKKKCGLKYKKKSLLERIAKSVIEDLLTDDALRIEIAKELYAYYKEKNNNDAYIKSLSSNLDDLEKKLGNILNAIENGIYNDTTADRMHELELQKKNLQDEIKTEELRKSAELKLDDILKFFHSFVDCNKTKDLSRIIDRFVDRIYVSEDKMYFTFYYSDDQRILDMDEMNDYICNMDKIFEILNGSGSCISADRKRKKRAEKGQELPKDFFA